jgi:DNA-binding response OmpR family regulator
MDLDGEAGARASAGLRPSRGPLPRVLVAHADRAIRQLVKLQLACAGYEVSIAEDAVEAGKAALREPPDLIVLDVDMPYIDELEFVSALQAEGGEPLIPVVFLTAREEALERAARLGAVACLTKPLHTRQLLDAVARCVRRQGEARSRVGFRTPPLQRAG